jgi:hypothetical protein
MPPVLTKHIPNITIEVTVGESGARGIGWPPKRRVFSRHAFPAAYAHQSEHTAMYPDDGDAVRWENGMMEHNTAAASGKPSNLDRHLPRAYLVPNSIA